MPILQWLTRDTDLETARKVPYRVLEEVPSLSYGDTKTADNMIVQGDNLHALKSLLPFYAGQVKCIYIDPPYNTKSAFEHYDDNLEHTKWLEMIVPRLVLLRDFLSEDGSIWVSIDDSEAAYMRVIMDEIFGRQNFIASNVWQKRYSRENREAIGDVHEYIFVYGVNPKEFKKNRNKVPLTEEQTKIYKNPNNDPNGRWRAIPMTAQGFRPNQMYPIEAPKGKIHYPPEGRCWGMVEPEFVKLKESNRIYFGKDQNSQPNVIRYLSEVEGMTPWTWWPSNEVGHTDEAKKEIHSLFGKKDAFDTPKPERLVERILHIATNPSDLVLDSFLGSGTTAAVAHKMGRRYIGIEMGGHARTHCAARLQKVVEGEQGGISEAVGWQGGGGFRFFELGEQVYDADGHICDGISFANLAAHIWFCETERAWRKPDELTTCLGINGETAYGLLYNGVLGDRRPQGGNVLTAKTLDIIRADLAAAYPDFDGQLVIYGESSRLSTQRLEREKVIFKQTPYDVRGA
ncbi:MAG: site-specific DNA-methyltransferase [Methylocystaceae bacterium]|nr:site-specific DNA-methyltransferase [Methylocystaceae bacterium]